MRRDRRLHLLTPGMQPWLRLLGIAMIFVGMVGVLLARRLGRIHSRIWSTYFGLDLGTNVIKVTTILNRVTGVFIAALGLALTLGLFDS
jgi:hypothetical protein